MSVIYQDDRITCDEDGLTIRWYYFPVGSKRILYSRIRSVEEHEMGAVTGRYRIWGTADPRYWLNLDPRRPRKSRLLVLDIGSWVKPVITPDDPEAVMRILRERTGQGS